MQYLFFVVIIFFQFVNSCLFGACINRIKYTQDLVHKITNMNLNSEDTLVLIDVGALFPNVPVDKLMKSLEIWLNCISIQKAEVENYIKLAGIRVEQNYFSHNNKF